MSEQKFTMAEQPKDGSARNGAHSASVEAGLAMLKEVSTIAARQITAQEQEKLNTFTMQGKEGAKNAGDGKGFLAVPNPADLYGDTNKTPHSAIKDATKSF